MEYLLGKLWFIKLNNVMYKILILIVSSILLLGSCEKIATNNKTGYLEDGNWVIGAFTINGINSMDIIKKYYADTRVDITIISRQDTETQYRVKVGGYAPISNSEGSTLIFTSSSPYEECTLSLFSRYLWDSIPPPEYFNIVPNLSHTIPPIKKHDWEVIELSEDNFTLSCVYKTDRIILYLTND